MAASYLMRSLECALSSPVMPPCTRNSRCRRRSPSADTGDSDWANVPSPRIYSPPSVLHEGCDLGDRMVDERSNSPNFGGGGSSSGGEGDGGGSGWSGETNNWASAIPLPRLMLLSGLTTLRLNVSLAGVSVRIPPKGLSINGNKYQKQGVGSVSSDTKVPLSAKRSPGGADGYARRQRARRCVRRVVQQLVERIHPVGASPGLRQACRLFRDEMITMGYDKAASSGVLRALMDTHARIRDAEEQDEDKDEGILPSLRPDGSERTTVEHPGTSTTTPEGREDVKELIEAGMVALPSCNAEDSRGAIGSDREPFLLDILSAEVCDILHGGSRRKRYPRHSRHRRLFYTLQAQLFMSKSMQ